MSDVLGFEGVGIHEKNHGTRLNIARSESEKKKNSFFEGTNLPISLKTKRQGGGVRETNLPFVRRQSVPDVKPQPVVAAGEVDTQGNDSQAQIARMQPGGIFADVTLICQQWGCASADKSFLGKSDSSLRSERQVEGL